MLGDGLSGVCWRILYRRRALSVAGSSASKAVIRITVVPEWAGQKDSRWSLGDSDRQRPCPPPGQWQ